MCMGLSYVTHNKNGNYYLLETYFSLKWHEPRKYLWSLGTAFALGIPIIHSHNDINMGSRAKLVVIKMTKIMTSLCRKDFSLHISELKTSKTRFYKLPAARFRQKEFSIFLKK